MRTFVDILKAPPSADVVDQDVTEICVPRLNILD